jgi:hypothetical protein
MSEEYGSENAKKVESKTRAGEYKTNNVKSSTFLPGLFNTDLNKKWLDSTLDQMLSKGELEDINAYIGSTKGKYRAEGDTYLTDDPHIANRVKTQFAPASVSLDADGSPLYVITFDDVANAVSNTFETYNYGAAYSTQAYNFAPPIDVDKFVNYTSYVWAPDMPIYVAQSSEIDINSINGQVTFLFTDDVNSFWLQNGQRIKMPDNSTYMITGVGKHINLIKIIDENKTLVYPFETKASSVKTVGIWDKEENGSHVEPYDSMHWDIGFLAITSDEKDYIVIDRNDSSQSAWSRNNHWVHRNTLSEMLDLCGIIESDIMQPSRRAVRPIIEFNANLEKYNMSNDYVGSINYLLQDVSQIPEYIKVGDHVVFATQPQIIKVFNGTDFDAVKNVADNSSAILINGWASTLSEFGDYVDITFNGMSWEFAQQKTHMNQHPLFELFDTDGNNIATYNETTFTGSKLFGYKIGTGLADKELSFPLVRKDMPNGAEIVFENYLHSERYNTRDIVSNTYVTAREIKGYYYYKEDSVLKTGLEQRINPLTAKHFEQQTADGNDITFAVGRNSWDVEREFIIELTGNDWKLTQLFSNGIYSSITDVNIALTKNRTYEFHNLAEGKAVVIHRVNETPRYENGNVDTTYQVDLSVFTDDNIKLSVVDSNDNVFGQCGTIALIDDDAIYYHNVKVNGTLLHTTEYTINDNSIIIPSSILSAGDIVDLEYYSNSTTESNDIQVPEITSHNVHNTIPTEFTLSETINHWSSLIEHNPLHEGDAFGMNNAHRLPQYKNIGGEITLHADTAVGYDITLSDNSLDVEHALYSQAKDWWAFKQRVIAQTRRLWASNAYYSVRQLTSDAIAYVMANRSSSTTYKNSNMLYNNDAIVQEYSIAYGESNIVIDSVKNANDHMYVYLQTEINGDTIDRQLELNVDYTLNGKKLTLVVPVESSVILRVYQFNNNDESNIPQSLTKLGLSHVYKPQVVDGVLFCHDGSRYVLNSTFTTELDSLYNTMSATFDPIAAVLYDIEKRIYSGLSQEQVYTDVSWLAPAQHRSRWFSNLTHVEDQFTYKYYKQWLAQTGRSEQTEYPDATDTEGWTWNYSGIDYGHHIGNDVPGYWEGAYTVLFDTSTPHITPWQMLGFSDKPLWWDEQYSWTDSAKRSKLLSALKHGIVSCPNEPVRTNLNFARYYWLWEARCPVDINGNLRPPKDVLIELPSDRFISSDLAQPFKFSDWSPAQMEWRNSALGHAAHMTAILKLQPAQAWSALFHINTTFEKNGLVLDKLTNSIQSIDNMQLTGNSGQRIKSIEVSKINGVPNSQEVLDNARIVIINGDPIIPATASYALNDGNLVSDIIIDNHGYGYKSTPDVILLDESGNKLFLDVDVEMEVIDYDANGLDTAINNLVVRSSYNTSPVDVFSNLDTRLVQKLGGFTSKHLVKFFTETSVMEKKMLGDNDYELVMYRGIPSELLTASSIKITKFDSGYTISGFSPNKQLFYFNEPDVTNPDSYTEVAIANSGATIRRFKNFSSTIVRGYIHYLTNNKYTFEQSADVYALSAAEWAVSANIHESTIITLGDTIEFAPEHGTILEVNSLPNQANSIIGTDYRTIDASDITVTRTTDSVIVQLRDDELDMGSVTFAIVDYEHAVIFKRTTEFNNVIFNDVTNQRYHRLKLEGQRTKEWHGERRAPGFLVFEDKIIQNWDSAVDEIRDYYDINVTKFNESIEKAERITNGNMPIDLFSNAGKSQNTTNEFYKGLIREKGTNNSLNVINRNNDINFGDSVVKHNEVWMFREKAYGDLTNINAVEIELRSDEFKSNPQILYFNNNNDANLPNNAINIKRGETLSNNRPRYVNDGEVMFDMISFNDRDQNYKFITAGDLLVDEADFLVNDTTELKSIYDTIEQIDSWEDKASYKRGDRVRLDGKLYECNVDATGINLVGSDVTVSGQIRYPIMPYGSTGIFRSSNDSDFVSVTFGSLSTGFGDLKVLGSEVDPIVYSQDNIGLSIDGTFVSLEEKELIEVTSTYPFFIGAAFPEIPNALETGTLTINNIAIDLADVNPPTVGNETLVGDGLTTTFYLDQNLGTYLPRRVFSIKVDTVTIDGQQQTLNEDYTVNENNNSITFITAPGEDNQYVADSYVTEDYVYDGHVDITVTFKVINYKSFSDIQNIIESSVDDIEVFLEDSKFAIRGTSLEPGSSLIIGPGDANSILGLVPGTYIAGTSLIYDHTFLNLENVIQRINDSNIDGVTASESGSRLVISSNNPSLVLNGTSTALSQLGIIAGTRQADAVTVEVPSDITEIVTRINDACTSAGVPISSANVDGYLVISNQTSYLEVGGTVFCESTGFLINNTTTSTGESSAIYSSQDSVVRNTFNTDEWNVYSDDPALVSVWVGDDSAFSYSSLGPIQVRYNSWNVYKFMDFGYYSNGDDGCSICAGTATSDGNDAEITMYKNGTTVDHGLQPGDYVMILNSTTTPSVDGIHKVTSVNQYDTTKFYIDMFIEECGTCDSILIMRSVRFNTVDDLISSVNNPAYYRYKPSELTYVTSDSNGNKTTSVYQTASEPSGDNDVATTINYIPVRTTSYRPTNTDINNVAIYDGDAKETQLELEVYDPLVGLIPGIADYEIDFKSPIDFAVYTDTSYENAWGNGKLGTVWWDTSNLRYIDYNQGDLAYRTKYWGKLTPGSSIDIYEWVRSDIPPAEWADAVNSNTEILGIIASGEVYSTYDKERDEEIYYYNEIEEWNPALQKYEVIYYFWVKNKTTIENTRRRLTVQQLTAIIENPTSYGISWCAAIDENVMIVSNVQQFINGQSSVLQINRTQSGNSHRSWTAIEENTGYITGYWFAGARDNLVGYAFENINYPPADAWSQVIPYATGAVVRYNEKQYNCISNVNISDSFELQKVKGCWVEQDTMLQVQRFPTPELHEYNRYGDDRSIGQGWFKDIFAARREAISVANELMLTINMYAELENGWDTRFNAHPDLWDWVDFVTPQRTDQRPTREITNAGYLSEIDTVRHSVVKVLLRDEKDNRDVSEIYQYIDGEWLMVEKKNATIQINDFLWNKARLASWDMSEWDSRAWDNDNAIGMFDLITALREDVFIGAFKDYFNVWWFSVINYVLSEHSYIDWLYKTTYITVYVETPLDRQARHYTRNNVDEVIGYVNQIKPFHTKVKEVFDIYPSREVAELAVSDNMISNITIKYPMTEAELTGELHRFNGTVYEGGDSDITVGSLDMASVENGEINAGELAQPELYDMNGRRYLFDMIQTEHIGIRIETIDKDDGSMRNVVYMRDDNSNIRLYGLYEDMTVVASSLQLSNINEFDDVIVISDNDNIGDNGYIYINGEIINYTQVERNSPNVLVLRGLTRGAKGTYAKAHQGSSVGYILKDDMVNLEVKDYGFEYDNLGNLSYNN